MKKYFQTFIYVNFLSPRRNLGLLISIFFSLCAVLYPSSSISSSHGLVLATGDNYAPFTGVKLRYGGMATRLVSLVFEKSEYSIEEILWLPWKRGFIHTKHGLIDGTFPYGISKERADSFHYSDSFFDIRTYAWTLKASKRVITVEDDLRNMVLCNPLGYANSEMIEERLKRKLLYLDSPTSMEICFKLLVDKKVDLIITTPEIAKPELEKLKIGLHNFLKSDLVIGLSSHHLIVSKVHPEASKIIKSFNLGLAKIKSNGTYDSLKAEFGWTE